MVSEQTRDDGTLGGQEEAVGVETGINEVKIGIFSARREQKRVLGGGGLRAPGPVAAGDDVVLAVVVQFRPEEFLEGLDAVKALEDVLDSCLAFAHSFLTLCFYGFAV